MYNFLFRNISACKEFAETVQTCYGPNGMNKMVINHLEKLFVTNDAATIIRSVFCVANYSSFQCCGSGSTCFWTSRIRIHLSEVWIRILLSLCKNSKKNLDSYYFLTLFDFLSLKNDVNVPSKSIKGGNEKQCGLGRRQMLGNGLGPWRSRFIFNLNMQFLSVMSYFRFRL